MPDRAFSVFTLQESRPGKSTRVTQIRWNNDDRAALQPNDPEEVAEFYTAARKWVEIIRRPDSEYWEQLRPGGVLSMHFCVSHVWRRVWGADGGQSLTIGGFCTEGRRSLVRDICAVVTVSELNEYPFLSTSC